jgi:hypothetical protein
MKTAVRINDSHVRLNSLLHLLTETVHFGIGLETLDGLLQTQLRHQCD